MLRTSTFLLPFRLARGRPRLLIGLCVGLVSGFLWPRSFPVPTRAVLGWDVAVAVFVVLSLHHFLRADHSDIADDAARQQEGEWTLFALVLLGTAMSFIAIVEFSGLNRSKGENDLYIALVTVTLASSWLMTNVTFAYRYAHEYYSALSNGTLARGLEFPSEAHPDYLDFTYFAFVIGMTFQVSDVQITARTLRRLATLHGLIGFVFNTVILALAINLAAGLI